MAELLGESSPLQGDFERMWNVIRQANLYGGRPRNESSEESLAVARRALDLAIEAEEPRFLAEAKSMMAYALNANEQYVESLPYYREAIRAWEQAGDLVRAARTRLGFITALSTTGQSQEALIVVREARRLFREQNDDGSLAKLETNLGTVYQRLDDHERAVRCFSESAELFDKTGSEEFLARSYLNLANSLCFLDRFTESEAVYGKCETIALRLKLDDLRAQALYNKAYLYFLSGRFSEALAVYRDVRLLFLKDGSRRHAALCDLDETEIYVQLRLPHDALLLAQAAAGSFATLDMPYERAKAIAFGGVALTQKRQFGDALAAFSEAQVLVEQDGNSFWSALLDLYRAEVLFSIGRLWEAHALASSANSKFDELGHPTKRMVALVLLGRVAMEMRRLDEANLHARMVRELARETNASLFLFACYALSAEIAERENRPSEALELYHRAATEIQLRHTHLHHDELGITFFKGKAEIFESIAHLTLGSETIAEADTTARAFDWCEKAKSQMFVDTLAPHLPSIRSRADEALLTRVERLRAELNGSYVRFRPEFLTTPCLPRGERIQFKEDELVRSLSELSKSDSEYVSLQTATGVKIEDLQRSLPEDTTILEYFFARDEVFAFVITKNSFEVVRHLTTVKRVQFLVKRLQYQLHKFVTAADQARADSPASKAATNELLGQAYNELAATAMRLVHTANLVVVPHGMLHRMPFHAFYDGEHYIAERHHVTYAPSASVLQYCLQRPVVTGGVPLRISHGQAPTVISGMPDSRTLSGPDALRETVLREVAHASFVHMEVPVTLRQDNAVLSGFELADSPLCVPDIYSMRWNTNLLSLRPHKPTIDLSGNGDDLLGLVRSFLYAGCSTVLLDLWGVREGASTLFLSEFYSVWLSGRTKCEALRAARLAVQLEYAHPFTWAQFFMVGRF